ncbi:MAG: PfaD family polyunsaturated fatty acid/polyketide biosynthesis protein [Myxococcota bacterium]
MSDHGLGWCEGPTPPAFTAETITAAVHDFRRETFVVRHPHDGSIGVAQGGGLGPGGGTARTWPVLGMLAPLFPEWLGDRSFAEIHGVRFPYVSGAMANGIATTELVTAMGRAGFLGFFGAAGLGFSRVEQAVATLRQQLGDQAPWGCNLIHSPQEPRLEEAVAQLYLEQGVRRVSAAAYMRLTPAIVRYAASGLSTGPQGQILRRNAVFAKISRPETARRFMEPAPAAMLDALVQKGQLTADEAALARHVPVAEDITVESDSGGHTDNRPLGALLPLIISERDTIAAARGYTRPIRVGAAGGMGAPRSVAAAFAMGAAYVLTGSVNQACVESGLDASGRQMLAEAGVADVMMAPAADMFELGVDVQVLRRGTMFAVRARQLYSLYRAHQSWDEIAADERSKVEDQLLRCSFADAWDSTRRFWEERDPTQIERADADPRHRMALVFRSYLGRSSRWAIDGQLDRRADYQIWCGPAMGAFNDWVRDSFLAAPPKRTVVQVARNLMEGAAVVTRAQQLRSYGVAVPPTAFDFRPRPLG